MKGTLFFHAPCFDGLVSAALMWDFLETARGWNQMTVRGVNYNIKSKWLSIKPTAKFAVVDFLYHPRATVWVDHHGTTFLNSNSLRSWKRRHSNDLIYDPSAPSCSLLIWQHLRQAFDYRNRRFAPMVKWATRITPCDEARDCRWDMDNNKGSL